MTVQEYKDMEAGGQQVKTAMSLPGGTILMLVALVFLSVMQEPVGWSALAWVALVPWVLAVVRTKRGGWMLAIGYGLGLGYYLGNLYWLAGVTALGYGGLCVYMACFFVLSGFILRRIYQKRGWPFTVVLPVVWVAQEYLRAVVMTGFPWLFLAHSQHESVRLIQISDILGAYGVTFLIGMVNGLVCDLLLRPLKAITPRQKKKVSVATLILAALCLLLGAVVYGGYRLRQGAGTITPGPVIAAIQENIPQYVKEQAESGEEIFRRHLQLSEQALQAGVKPELIVWPETMTCTPLNQEFLDLQRQYPSYDMSLYAPWVQSQAFDRQLRELAGRGAAVLVGTPSLLMKEDLGGLAPAGTANSAILYLAGGQRFGQRYDKMHLVPFGEVVPFKKSWPWMYRLLNSLTPYDYEYSLDAGENPVVFAYPGADGQLRKFAVAICYEDVTPHMPRTLTVEKGQKRIDFLLNISNDGWFVRGGNGKPVTATSELLQHLAICKFRAVENRIGIVRAVNTGISGFIRPDGAVQPAGLAGTLPEEPRQRQAVAGFLTDRVYLDTRLSLYSRMGDWFAIVCCLFSLLFFADSLRKKRPGLAPSVAAR